MYEKIERLQGEATACRIVLAACGHRHSGTVTSEVFGRLAHDFVTIEAGILRIEEQEALDARQKEITTLRAAGHSWDEIDGMSGEAISSLAALLGGEQDAASAACA